MKLFGLSLLSILSLTYVQAQNFPGIVGEETYTAIHKDADKVDYWVDSEIDIHRGWLDTSQPDSGYASVVEPGHDLGYSDQRVAQSVNGGCATHILDKPIYGF